MTEFPDDIQEAIEWFHEADCEHTAACQEYDRVFGEAYVGVAQKKREERFSSLSVGDEVDLTIARLAAMDQRTKRDFWLLQCTRRGNWVAYLISRNTATTMSYDAPTTRTLKR